jgi:hypothetical protein
MPLQSRANRTTTPVARPAAEPQAGADLNTSPRKRVPQPAAPEPELPAREEVAAEQAEEAAPVEREQPAVQTQEPPAAQAAAGVAKRVTRKRATKPKPELPDDLSRLLESDDPAELRASLKLVEDTVRDKRKAFEDELKVFRTLYRDLSDKLAGTL